MRLRRVHIVATIIAGLVFLGCGHDESARSADGRVTVTFWHSFTQATRPALNKLIERFHEEHPNIRLEAQYIPTGDALVQKLITSVQSGTAPDISWIHSHYMGDLVQADAVYQMSHFIEGPNGLADSIVADIYPSLIQYASWQGTMYSMPMEATNLGIVYNKDHFRAAGLDPERPPQTWDELREYCRKLRYDRNGDGRNERIGFFVPAVPAGGPQGAYMEWQFLPFMWQAGGDIINEDQTRVLYDTPGAVQALTFWKELYDMQNQRTFTSEYELTLVASGQVSMMLDGPWNLPRYDQLLNFDWGIGMLPAGPEKRATVVAGEFLAIFKQSAHPDEAWQFVKWMIQPEIQAFWSMESGYLPIRHAALKVPEFQQFLQQNPGQKAFVEQMEYAIAQRPLDFYAVEIQRHLAEAIEKATVGGADPKAALEESAAKSNRLLAQVARR